MSNRTDPVVVIGAGILGALTAYRLVERGAEVTLIEARAPGSGTTATGYAHVNASYAGYWDYFALRAAGITGYRQLRAELGEAPWLVDVGCIQFESDRARRKALQTHAQRLRGAGYPVAQLTRSRLGEMEPDLQLPAGLDDALFYTDEGYVDGPALVSDLLNRAVGRGLDLRTNDPVVDIQVVDDQVRSVTLQSGEQLGAGQIVCCAGRWSDAVLESAGVGLSVMTPDVPGAPTPGLIVTTTAVEHRLRRMVIADGVNIRPGAGGRLVVWSGDVDAELQDDQARSGTKSDQADRLAAAVLEAARPFVASLAGAQIESATVCVRALPRDGLPAIGWIPGLSGLYLVTAHAATTLGPAAAELVAAELLDGADAHALNAFRPARFALRLDAGATTATPRALSVAHATTIGEEPS
jgi:glycine/D-amino acid oxidase-like deaminating enzyme